MTRAWLCLDRKAHVELWLFLAQPAECQRAGPALFLTLANSNTLLDAPITLAKHLHRIGLLQRSPANRPKSASLDANSA